MAGVISANLFALLDEDNSTPTAPVGVKASAAAEEKSKAAAPAKEAPKSAAPARGGRGGGRGGRGGRGFDRDAPRAIDAEQPEGTAPYGGRGRSSRGGGRGRGEGRGRGRGEGRGPRREYDRRDATGRGHEVEKRNGAGRGNWGTEEDDLQAQLETARISETAAPADADAPPVAAAEADAPAPEEPVKEEEEEKQMSLDEYEKIVEEQKAKLNKKKEVTAVDLSQFKGMQALPKEKEEEATGLELANTKAKAKASKDKALKEKQTVEVGFRGSATQAPRGRRGGREGGRGYGGRGFTPRDGGRGTPRIDDSNAFPAL